MVRLKCFVLEIKYLLFSSGSWNPGVLKRLAGLKKSFSVIVFVLAPHTNVIYSPLLRTCQTETERERQMQNMAFFEARGA